MTVSPTARTVSYLRAQGWPVVEVVEQTKRAPGKTWKVDLFGIGDVLAIRPGEVLLVQTTSRDNVASRIRKIAEHPNTPHVREAGIGIHVHGWGKMANGRVELRTVDVS